MLPRIGGEAAAGDTTAPQVHPFSPVNGGVPWRLWLVVGRPPAPWKVVGNDIPVDRVPDYINRPNYGFAKGTGTDDVGIRLFGLILGLWGVRA